MRNPTLLLKAMLISAITLLSGCATHQASLENDAFEGYNRAMYSFNKGVDNVVLKPAAQAYDTVVPVGIDMAISNFFSNLNDITVVINDLLQFKFEQASKDFGRLALNTTVGFGGILDVATEAGYEKNNEDFGQTLGAWGVEPGSYVVLPFFGPRTVRDSFGLVGDIFTDPVTYVEGPDARNPILATRIINAREDLLRAEKVLDEAAIDEYNYIRSAYLQQRQSLVYDGTPPEEEFDVFAP